MRTFLAFIKWIFVKVGEGLVGVHEGFKYELRNNTGMAIFAWFIVSFLTTIATLLILGAIQHFGRIDVPVEIWFMYIASCVFYLLYTGINIMYNAFKAERAELFETIKNGR